MSTPTTKSGKLFSFVTSGSRGWAKYYSEDGPAFLRIGNLDHDSISLDLSDIQRVSPPSGAEGSRTRVKPADILISITADVGMVGLVPPGFEEAYINQHVALARPVDGVNPAYLAWCLASPLAQRQFQELQRGATKVGLGLDDIRAVDVPVPPLDEQRRIVAEIEQQFTRLEAGVTALRQMQAKLKRYRAAVLKAACEGRLVPTEAEQKTTPLGNLIEGLGQGWSPKCDLTREPLPDEWAIITTTAVQSMRYIDNQGKPLPEALKPRPHLEIKAGDFLMTRKGPRQRAGVACLVRKTRHRLMVCDTVYRFRCREDRVVPSYLELALNSPNQVSQIDRLKAGINDSGVSLTHDKLGGVKIPLPPLAEQTRIVAEVERRLSVVAELEGTIAANLQRAARLRQSILQRAFCGSL